MSELNGNPISEIDGSANVILEETSPNVDNEPNEPEEEGQASFGAQTSIAQPTPRKAGDAPLISKRLQPNGMPLPEALVANLIDLSYPSPMAEFVLAPQKPTLSFLCRKWRVGLPTLKKWQRNQEWDAQRKEHWLALAEESQDITSAELSELRARSKRRQLCKIENLELVLDDMLRHRTKQVQRPSGALDRLEYSPTEIGALMRAYQLLWNEERAILGDNPTVNFDEEERGATATASIHFHAPPIHQDPGDGRELIDDSYTKMETDPKIREMLPEAFPNG